MINSNFFQSKFHYPDLQDFDGHFDIHPNIPILDVRITTDE